MDRYLLISSDCHAGAPWTVYRDYLDAQYREDWERWVSENSSTHRTPTLAELEKERPRTLKTLDPEKIREYEAAMDGSRGHLGNWDPVVRVRELDREGVAGEVIFPDGTVKNPPPFGVGFFMPKVKASYELRAAGCRAHNRWLADFCATNPGRHAGVALIAIDRPEEAAQEIEWARKNGLFGGIMLPPLQFSDTGFDSFWHHPRYEPIWRTCQELEMPINVHIAANGVEYGGLQLARLAEFTFNTYRPFWFLVYGGVLERYPQLQIIFTESGGMQSLWFNAYLDWVTEERPTAELKALGLSLKPSEYWQRQCYVGASAQASRAEIDNRERIGVRNILWGSDYPHPEGTWPVSLQRTKKLFAGVPEDETRMMLGENCARVYGFDLDKMRKLAARIGPTVWEITGPG